MLLEQLLAKLDVFSLGILLAQASVDSLLPLVVLGLALRSVSVRSCLGVRSMRLDEGLRVRREF